MESLSVLAGGVAHDLNNVLGPLIGLPDVVLAELAQLDVRPESTAAARLDLETMRSATLRASQTIKDLLTLSRQGRTIKERLELNRTVLDCLDANDLHKLLEAFPGISIVCEISRERLVICGSESHIARAVANLLRNAVEAVVKGGEVRVKTFAVSLKQAAQGYETVPAGKYAVVVVSDNGVGIPSHEIVWVFELNWMGCRCSMKSATGFQCRGRLS